MARWPVHTAQRAPEPTRAALAAAEQGAGYLSNLLGVLANAPVALEAYQTLSQINARSGLTLQEREVVQLVAGTRHGCTSQRAITNCRTYNSCTFYKVFCNRAPAW